MLSKQEISTLKRRPTFYVIFSITKKCKICYIKNTRF